MPLKNGGLTLIPTRVAIIFNSKSLDFQSEHRALIPIVGSGRQPKRGGELGFIKLLYYLKDELKQVYANAIQVLVYFK